MKNTSERLNNSDSYLQNGEGVLVNNPAPKRTLKRESGLELLRIFAMLLIVMHHVYLHGGITFVSSVDEKICSLLGTFGKLGVNVFVLISAYFMVNKTFRLTRILNLVLRSTFYALFFYFLFVIFCGVDFSFQGLVQNLFPIYFEKWWFVTCFILLMLLSPAINIVLHSVKPQKLGWCILGMVSCTVLLPYITKVLTGSCYEVPYLDHLFVFIELYCVAGYIKLYGISLKKHWIVLITCFTIFLGLLVDDCGSLGDREGWQLSSFCNVVGSVGMLLIFKDFKFQSRVVNLIASTTFGIYLIHENPYIRRWEYAFCRETLLSWVHSPVFMYFLLIITIFFVAMIIDLICLHTIHHAGKKFLQFIDKKIAEQRFKTPKQSAKKE